MARRFRAFLPLSFLVIHHVEGSLWPSDVGSDQRRPAALEGNRLTLSDGKTLRVVRGRMRR